MTDQLSAISPSDHPNNQTEDKRIHVKNGKTLTNLFMGVDKMVLSKKLNDEEWKLFTCLIMLANKTFEDGYRFPEVLWLKNRSILEQGGADSVTSLRRRREKLATVRVNGHPIVEISEPNNHGGATVTAYRINYDLLLTAWNPLHRFQPKRQQKTENAPHQIWSGQPDSDPLLIPKRDHKIPNTPPEDLSTPASKEVATLEGGDSFQSQEQEKTVPEQIAATCKEEIEEVEEVVQRLEQWNVRRIRKCFNGRSLAEMWRIIEGFENDANRSCNMRDPSAVLYYRLVNGIHIMNTIEEAKCPDVDPHLREDFQSKINTLFEQGRKSEIMGYMVAFYKEAGLRGVTEALKVLDLGNTKYANLDDWYRGVA